MHDELVKRLRKEAGEWCANCCYKCGDNVCGAPDERKKDCDVYTKLHSADAIERLEAALILMVLQYCSDDDGTLYHQFMCAGEGAFDALGITLKTNPQVLWDRLDEIEAKEKQRRKTDD